MNARLHRDERGAETVEFIFILIMMALLFMIFVDFGRAFTIQAAVAEASRTAARAISVGENPSVCDVLSCSITPNDCANRHKGDRVTVSISMTLDLLPLPDWINPQTVTSTTIVYMQEDC